MLFRSVGGALLVAGLAMLVLPGPGLLVLAAGMAVLAVEFPWARRMLSEAVQNCKAVVFAGLPGVGKTLLLQQTALLSHAADSMRRALEPAGRINRASLIPTPSPLRRP